MIVGFYPMVGDLLHAGHIIAIEEAKANCDYLIVGLNCAPDGKAPIQSIYERFMQLRAVKYIDEIIPYAGKADLELLAASLPYAAMIGAVIAFTALIPVAGAYIGGGVGAFIILMESPVKAVVFLIFLVVLQQVEGNIIYPRVVGSSLGLPAIWVLAAVTVGGGVMGIPGMLLGAPLAAAVYRFVCDDVNKTAVIEGSLLADVCTEQKESSDS